MIGPVVKVDPAIGRRLRELCCVRGVRLGTLPQPLVEGVMRAAQAGKGSWFQHTADGHKGDIYGVVQMGPIPCFVFDPEDSDEVFVGSVLEMRKNDVEGLYVALSTLVASQSDAVRKPG